MISKVTKLTAEQITAACKSTKRTVWTRLPCADMGQNLAGFPGSYRPWKERQKNNLACIRIPDGRRSLQSTSGPADNIIMNIHFERGGSGDLAPRFSTMASGIFRWKALC